MEPEKLSKIVEEKNVHLEREAVRTAEELIEAIIREQQFIARANEKIASFRTALKDLEVQNVDIKTILGEQ